MKPIIVTSVILLAGVAGGAMADCSSDPLVTGTALSNLMNGSLVCGRPGASYPGSPSDRWQEEHLSAGALFDYKLGSNPADPREQVGRWAISGNQVRHGYSAGNTYTWEVRHVSGNTYRFCVGPAEHVVAFIGPNGNVGCGGNFPP